ncbi:DUF6210 family protein [Flavobacterium urocaniciphilum]|uniref:Uncharacterized protein n=1 Tax=Flavobacterium urocaniciphilum TaxID=1299341 RepID=A0A1H8YT73_9FLAO|nr:DUF6210 family protein [Flavobacterium urocaniciphilum]SEP55356.1 hypothetical protein SAMN05444005_101184 [Flavobacterium urocaniciphilum]
MLKPTIKIYDAVGLGLIISFPSGVEILNQTGGIACNQSAIEGIYLPIANECSMSNELISPEIELMEYFSTYASDSLQEIDVENINKILEKYKLSDFIKIDFDKLTESHESWIYVNVSNDEKYDLLDNFNFPLKGVLTWSNSD